MYKRILVPLDGSDTARFGLREAITLAREQKATLRLLYVVSEFQIMMEMAAVENYEKVQRGILERADAMLQEAKALAASLEVPAETALHELKHGRVADAIVDDAQQSGCDLIVIGTHGRRGVSRALLGSDAELVLRQASVPVLLVRERPTRT